MTTLKELKGGNKVFTLKNESGNQSGTLTFDQFTYVEKPSFTDYLRSGWFINMSAAIDFTASNGEQYDPSSLHRQY